MVIVGVRKFRGDCKVGDRVSVRMTAQRDEAGWAQRENTRAGLLTARPPGLDFSAQHAELSFTFPARL